MRPECLLAFAMERMVDYYHNGRNIIKHRPLRGTRATCKK